MKETTVQRSSSNASANLYGQALHAIDEHDYKDAEVKLLRWLASHREDRYARYQLALVRRCTSTEALTRLLSVAAQSYHVHQMLGQIYVRQEEDAKALTEYRTVASAQPNLAGIHFWLGHLYWKQGDVDHATIEFERELQIDPGHAESNAELGAILVAEEKGKEAIPHLKSAIQVKPDLWPAYPQLGRAYAMQKDYARAETVLQGALPHDIDGSAHYQLAMVLRDEGKSAQAAQLFAQVKAIKKEQLAADNINAAGGIEAVK